MTWITWVRHGPTHQKTFVGHRDVPADLTDRAAVARVSAALPEGPVGSSDLVRAVTTAEAIAGSRQMLPPDPALREFDFGAWDGLGFERVAEGWPELSRTYWEEPGDIAPPDGESWNVAAARVNAAVDRLLAAQGGPLTLVAHLGVILTQVQRGLDASPKEALVHRIDPLSITEVRYGPDREVGRINHHP